MMYRLQLTLVVLAIILIAVVCPGCPPRPTRGSSAPPLPDQPATVPQDAVPASSPSSPALAEKAPECPLPTDLRMYKVANLSEDAFASYVFISLIMNGAIRSGKDDADICVVRATVVPTSACVVTKDKFGNPYTMMWNPSQTETGEKAVKGLVDSLLSEQRFKWELSQSQAKVP